MQRANASCRLRFRHRSENIPRVPSDRCRYRRWSPRVPSTRNTKPGDTSAHGQDSTATLIIHPTRSTAARPRRPIPVGRAGLRTGPLGSRDRAAVERAGPFEEELAALDTDGGYTYTVTDLTGAAGSHLHMMTNLNLVAAGCRDFRRSSFDAACRRVPRPRRFANTTGSNPYEPTVPFRPTRTPQIASS